MEAEKMCITMDEAAEIASTGRRVIQEWVYEDGSFPCFAVGRKMLIPVDSFREWLNNRGKMRVGLPKGSGSKVMGILEANRRKRRRTAELLEDEG